MRSASGSTPSRQRTLTAAMCRPLGIDGLAERMDAAGRAEAVLDQVPVEGVGAHLLLGRAQLQLFAGHEPHEGALARADGAVAGHSLREFAFHIESDAAAVADAVVFHPGCPWPPRAGGTAVDGRSSCWLRQIAAVLHKSVWLVKPRKTPLQQGVAGHRGVPRIANPLRFPGHKPGCGGRASTTMALLAPFVWMRGTLNVSILD